MKTEFKFERDHWKANKVIWGAFPKERQHSWFALLLYLKQAWSSDHLRWMVAAATHGQVGTQGHYSSSKCTRYFILLICHFEHPFKLQFNECTDFLLLFLLTHHTFGQSCSRFSWEIWAWVSHCGFLLPSLRSHPFFQSSHFFRPCREH